MNGDHGGPRIALRDFDADVELLGGILDDVVRAGGGERTIELRDRAVHLARRARRGDEPAGDALAELIAGLDLDDLELLIRSLTRWFQLINLAEDNERVRRIRARTAREAPRPRRGSVADAVAQLADREQTAADIAALLDRAEIRLVMTAHPTEARRRTTIDKQARVFRELRALDDQLGRDEHAARRRIRATVQELWGSDELRAASLTVLDEVRGGLVHFTSTLADTIPIVYRELEQALAEQFPHAPDVPVPPILRFGSWIGGDRDGNPNVTPETTAKALELMREQCAALPRVARRADRRTPVAVRPGQRTGAAARAAARARRADVPGARGAARRAQPRGAVPARADVHPRARPRDRRPGRADRLRDARRTARGPARRRAIARTSGAGSSPPTATCVT